MCLRGVGLEASAYFEQGCLRKEREHTCEPTALLFFVRLHRCGADYHAQMSAPSRTGGGGAGGCYSSTYGTPGGGGVGLKGIGPSGGGHYTEGGRGGSGGAVSENAPLPLPA